LAPGDCGESGVTPLTCSEEIDLMSESFSAFREQYLSRHENPVNSALHTVAAVVAVGGLAAAVVTRRIRVALIGDTVAFAIATVGHLLFQPGTLRDDLVEDFRHPIWYVRAEGQRIFARPT
jgi:hypothetical protein